MNRLISEQITLRASASKLAYIFFCFLLVVSCAVKYQPSINIVESNLVTNSENIEMELSSERKKQNGFPVDVNDQYIIDVIYNQIYIRFFALPGQQKLMLQYGGDEKEIEFIEEDTFYQKNNDPRQPLSFNVINHNSETGQAFYYEVNFDYLEPLSTYNVTMTGGSLYESTIKKIKKGEDDIHRFYFPFSFNRELYAVDVAFKLQVDAQSTIDVPGGHP